MLSAKDFKAVRTAVKLCNKPELKREILCAPGSDYDIELKRDILCAPASDSDTNTKNYQFDSKKKWDEIIEKKAAVILENSGLAKQFQEKVMGIAHLVGMKMLIWAEYHEGTLGFSREYSVNFLKSSFFTKEGTIDNLKVAEELMKDNNLSIKQKYKLSCLYCLKDNIGAYYRQMTKEDKKEFFDAERPEMIKQPELVKFWSYHLMDQIDILKGEKNIDQYRLESAVKDGSQTAVKFCLEKTNLCKKKEAILYAAVEAARYRVRGGRYPIQDWIVFRNQKYKDSEESWIPSDYYTDILYFILPKMTDDQKIYLLKNDITGILYKKEPNEEQKRNRVLEYFLSWPYQDRFMEAAKLAWYFLSVKDYAVLLLRICDKIECPSAMVQTLTYGEDKSYNYRGLLKEFWENGYGRYKRFVFSNQEITYTDVIEVKTKACEELLMKLLNLKNFTIEDGENIKSILNSATNEEKENFIYSDEWRKRCFLLMSEEKWEILDRFVLNCFECEDQADYYKEVLVLTMEAQCVCSDFVKNEKWDAAESFIKWSSLPEEGIDVLKREIIESENGKGACVDLISRKKVEVVEKFIQWCRLEDVETCRKLIVSSNAGICKCADLVKGDQLELVDELINFGLSSVEEVRELKKKVAYKKGNLVCEELISNYSEEDIYNERGYPIGRRIKFDGGQWEKVEKFLTWCFSSEEEIREFKKELLQTSGRKIHFKLMEANRWEEAETFFAWLGLSAEEIKELKRGTLFNHGPASAMFSELLHSEEGYERFADFGSREEAIELLLRWCLTDEETVREFSEKFKSEYKNINEDEEILYFDFLIDERLRDLDEENGN